MKFFNSKPEHMKNRVTLIATLTAHYQDQGVLRIIEAAKNVPSMATAAKRVEAEQIQLWLKNYRTPDSLLTLLSLDKAGDQLLASPRFQTWSKFTKYYNKENPDEAETVVARLANRLGDEALTPVLVAARKVPKTKDIAAELQAEQFKRWLSTNQLPENIFKLLQLDKAGDDLLANPQLNNWFTYTKDFNLNLKNVDDQASTIAVLRDNFDDDVLARMILAAKKAPSTQSMAQRVEDDLFRGWIFNLNSPDGVFRHLKLNEAGENRRRRFPSTEKLATKLQADQIQHWLVNKDPPDEIFNALMADEAVEGVLTSPLFKIWGSYFDDFNAKFPSKKASMIDAFRTTYDDEALAFMLLTAKEVPSTEKLATKLQTDQLQRWLANKDTPEDVFRALLLDDAVDDVLANPLLNTWVSYLDAFNAKHPRSKVSMVDTLREFFGDRALAKTLTTAKEVASTKSIATKLEASLINKWILAKKTPASVSKMLGVHETKLLEAYTTSPSQVQIASWPKRHEQRPPCAASSCFSLSLSAALSTDLSSLLYTGDKDRKERKHSRKASSSSSRKSSRRDDERSSRHKSHKSHDAKLPKGVQKITEEDYFLRQTEFRVWLAQTKSKYVDDLSTDEAMGLFTDEFARKWNRGKLSEMFYDGLPDAVVEQTKRTRHRWGFVTKLGEKEKFELATAKDSVDVATKKENLLSSGGSKEKVQGPKLEEGRSSRDRSKRPSKEDKEDGREADRKRRKSERRRERADRDTVLDELAPKATGREAQIEKRRQLGEKLHGAARDREDARDGLDLSEEFLMGGRAGGDGHLRHRLAQRDSARRRKQEEQQEKLAGLKAKESARMDKFLEDMGLAGPNANSGKPMTIAPRR
ncbi:hypothetical protein PHYPSEUDO_002779 [Phytophthora pseudosyringae]|uniref:RxLR effector PexRD54 WY domain-containing protein n=1 Tax=Phytophthora pseudosyringae TaxID=221518 RepID=A0A8T1VXJ6_9STRA|nr:hypothetical protein PHYPSEUDO_002779 [Phytophthora pseudosyringae]